MSKTATLFMILILIGVGYGAYRWYEGTKSEPVPQIVVEDGDYVVVNYTGWLKDERIYGTGQRVFDTSRQDVAEDNVNFPKSSTFFKRDAYSTFGFKAGTGQVIAGWDKNILGMKKGDTAKWTIDTFDAYEPRLDSLVINISRQENTTKFESYDLGFLQARYPAAEILPGIVLDHFFWDWDMQIESVDPFDNSVTIYNMPTLDEIYTSLYGFESQVTYINQSDNDGQGKIIVKHTPSTGDLVETSRIRPYHDIIEDVVLHQSEQGGITNGIVVDLTQNDITIDFNSEVYGRTLVFEVTLLEIERGA